MHFDPNPLFYKMGQIFQDNYSPENKVIICNEGSSRSSKTFDAFHFIIAFCDHNRNKENDIYILRETLQNCRDYTFKDFQKCCQIIGISPEFKSAGQKPYCNLWGNNIYFRGLDDEKNMEGYPSDILFFNETLEIKDKSRIAGLRMRCRKLIIMDWNPKFTQHWCFDLEGQPNTFFTHSTYKQNKHLQKSVVQEIESYEPTPENIKNGTADDYRWKVYGLGIRSAPEGLIFEYVTWIEKFPDMGYSYTLDFGFTTDPTALTKYAEDEKNIYIELLLYESTENADLIHEFALKTGIDIKIPTTADSADKYTGENKGTVEMVDDLRKKGWNVSKVSKTKSVMYWLTSMKKKKIHIVKNHNYQFARKEQENYTMKKINGIAINQPIDQFNHMWDSARYGHIANNQPKVVVY